MASASLADYKTPRPWIILAVFLVVVIGVGGLIGTQSVPGEWYQSLNKPPFNPPNWIFGPVWFALYIMIAVAGWRIYMIDPTSPAMKIWYGQMVLNWAWSPVWFIAQARLARFRHYPRHSGADHRFYRDRPSPRSDRGMAFRALSGMGCVCQPSQFIHRYSQLVRRQSWGLHCRIPALHFFILPKSGADAKASP
ncbi:TspO/MBR family protein [Devosia algicola]